MIAMNYSLQQRIRQVMREQNLDYRAACAELGRHAVAAKRARALKRQAIERERERQERMGVA